MSDEIIKPDEEQEEPMADGDEAGESEEETSMDEAEMDVRSEDVAYAGDEEVEPEEGEGVPANGAGDEEEIEPGRADEEGEPPPEADAEEEARNPSKELPPEALALCRSAIEAMLFASAEPVRSRKLADALKHTGVDGRGVRRIVRELQKEYADSRRGFTIEEVAGGFQMLTRLEYADYVSQLLSGSSSGKLSQAALETLAVVAYKQPVTRADVEAIRGVQAGPLLRTLLHKNLVKIAGRAEVLGRPLLYGTTKKFLQHFGLNSLNELPRVEELPRP